MKFFVGVTDNDWFDFLAKQKPDEVNFWRPGGKGTFKAVEPGGLFLFKLHSPQNFITGGGHFVRYSRLPLSLAWRAFEQKNGVMNEMLFRRVIQAYRRDTSLADPEIGCIILTEPFFLPRELWIPAPADWPKSAVQGKGFDTNEAAGRAIWEQVQQRLALLNDGPVAREPSPPYGPPNPPDAAARYTERLTKVRLGQGGFRVVVTEAYDRRCAITGEKTLPVLEAAHIKPYAEQGPHSVNNGLLLRADMHILFDLFYLTVTPERRICVSKNIHEHFTNGKLYYSYQGQALRALPSNHDEQPSENFLRWHNEAFVRAGGSLEGVRAAG